MICMKNIGQQAKAFREAKGWSYTRMAEEVSKHHTEVVSRQLITQLEIAGDRTPRYLRALAATMGTTSDALLAGLEDAPDGSASAAHTAESPAPSYAGAPSAATIRALAQHLDAISPNARERAATLLANMARDPAGPWAVWLISLLSGDSDKPLVTTSVANSQNLQQNDLLDLSAYPGLKNATEWRRGKKHGDGDNDKAPKKQGGNSS